MNDIAVSKDGVIKLLKGLNPSKALGPDELGLNIFISKTVHRHAVYLHTMEQWDWNESNMLIKFLSRYEMLTKL